MSFLNPFTPKPADSPAASSPEVKANATDSTASPAPTPPGTIPEKMDLEFFNTLVKPEENKAPNAPLSVTKDILTPENLKKIAEGQNFSSAIPPAVLEKLQNGDQAATMEAVEHIARAAHSAALAQTGAIIDTVLAQQGTSLESRIRKDVEDSINLRDITKGVPNTDQPIVKAGIEMISSQLRAQFPQASSDQVRTMAQNYFTELSAAINPPSPSDTPKPKDAPVDWMQYAGFTPPSQ